MICSFQDIFFLNAEHLKNNNQTWNFFMKKGCVNIFPVMWQPLFHSWKICDWFLLSPPISCSPFLSLRNFIKALSLCYVYSLECKTLNLVWLSLVWIFFQCLRIFIGIIYIPQRKLEEKDSISTSPILLLSGLPYCLVDRIVHQTLKKSCIYLFIHYTLCLICP